MLRRPPSLVIRGEKDEQAVLCSKDKTYDMKIADTSNMLLFIPGCKTPEQLNADPSSCNIIHSQASNSLSLQRIFQKVQDVPHETPQDYSESKALIAGFSNNYWELRRCRPKLKKLRKLLMEDPYEGPDSRKDQALTFSKYTTEDLLSLIQASEEEILHQLQAIDACKIEGYWRILEFDYEMKLLNHVTQLIDSESWSLSKVPLRTCLEELGSLEPREMIEHILLSYGRKYVDDGEVYFEMHEDKICRAVAQMLLKNAVKFNLSEFQEVWQQSVPEGMTTRLDQLKGLALVDKSSRPETISLLKGYVELTIFPTVANLNRIKLNSKQCRIYRVRVNDLEAAFIYNDPTLEVCHQESKQRNLNYFSNAYAAAVSAVDPDAGNGELCIKVPSELWKHVDELKVLKVHINFSLDQPKGGLHFVVPNMEGNMAERGAHVFSCGYQNSTRFWFPCVDSYSELCTWKLEYTVDAAMVAVSNGDLVETVYTHDMRKKTFHYMLTIPTAASNISLAIGPFEILVDPYMHEVTHFCLPQLLPLLKHTTSYLHEVFEFYEEILTCRYPYSCFKTVFIDEAYVEVAAYASMSIFSTNLLHSAMIIDETPLTRRCLAQALAQQFFGCFISRMSWSDEWVLKGISGYIYGLWMKKTFGVNEYRHWIKQELDKIVAYELKTGGVLLHPIFGGGKEKDKKRNVLELEIKQDYTSPGTQKYVGPLKVTVQELDGSFNHTLQIEENSLKHDIPCHSKSRRNKKKKIPLMNGEEVDMDLSAMDADSPLLWIRIDPDMSVLRKVEFEQSDFMWQYQLRYERDVVAQEEAILALEKFPTPASRLALTDILEQEQCFYRVRMLACFCLAKIANSMVSTWTGPPAMKSLFTRMFCCKTCPNIVKTNNFMNFQSYFLQKTMPVAMALLRDVHNLCPKEVLMFILDLIKYNDNRKNKFSDNYYRAELIDALANSVTPAVSVNNEVRTLDNLNPDVRLILEEITRFLNMEKLLPSYRHTITVSCLKAIRVLQKNGHVPSDPALFKSYAEYGHFIDVRIAALEAVVDYTKDDGRSLAKSDGRSLVESGGLLLLRFWASSGSEEWFSKSQNPQDYIPSGPVDRSYEELQWLLDMVQSDPVPYIRHKILDMLTKNPPFTKNMESPLCNEALVDQLWKLMNSGTSHDWRLRCGAVDLYFTLFGLSRPSCLPLPELGLVLNLKEKKAVLNPTIIPEAVANNQEPVNSTTNHGQSVGFQNTEDDHLIKETASSISGHQQGVKRKADMPLGSPLEPGQILEKNEDSKVKLKIRFSNSQEEEEIDMDTVHDSQAFIYHHLNMLERPSTPGMSKFIGKMTV
ncbi:TATA-box binding protein associated factor 2 [Willisornis vidua]|uniref:Transcription initiation factor TFIID subunit 2 n=1 Tax=Willisornis vidua TaxID=1566151 RepID=A0ABQ9CLU2_9PASS|nr:TATA-box binding protein associated factor 2 [Willisornis vidua]